MSKLEIILLLYIILSQVIFSILIMIDIDNNFAYFFILISFPIISILIMIDMIVRSIYRKLNPPKPLTKEERKEMLKDLNNAFSKLLEGEDDE